MNEVGRAVEGGGGRQGTRRCEDETVTDNLVPLERQICKEAGRRNEETKREEERGGIGRYKKEKEQSTGIFCVRL
jgi:hypothetical protein